MARYELREGTSNYFWQIRLTGKVMTTSYGRVGTKGQSTTKSFDSVAKAKIAHGKLISEKVKKGYELVANTSAKKRTMAPVTATAPSAVSSRASVRSPEKVRRATLAWTPALDEAAADQRYEFEILPTKKSAATKIFGAIQKRLGSGEKEDLQSRGVLGHSSEHDAFVNRVLETYEIEPMQPELDLDVEATALLVLPLAIGRAYRATIVDFWVAHSGLAFALEAFAKSLDLSESEEWAPLANHLWQGRVDIPLRGHLLGGTTKEQAHARAKAVALRERGSLFIRSAMSSIFLEPEWIDADLEERVRTGERAIVTDRALQHTTNARLLAKYFSVMTEWETQFLSVLQWEEESLRWGGEPPAFPRKYDKLALPIPPFSLVIADRFRDDAIAPLACWLSRAAHFFELDSTADEGWAKRHLLPTIADLVRTLQWTDGSPEVVEAFVAVLVKLGGAKPVKNHDPRPDALETLRRSPELALPLAREAAAHENGAWAQELVAQLEHRSSIASVVEATDEDVPHVLRSTRRFRAPSFWSSDALARPLTKNKTLLPRASVDALGALLAKRDRAALETVKETCDADSLAAFAWDLFQIWLTSGAPKNYTWPFLALGLFGDDACARKIDSLLRAWSDEFSHHRQRILLGLDALAEIGSDVALMRLNGIALMEMLEGPGEGAREKMDEVAKKRGFTREELADRVVPDLGLEDDGSKTLDFGPRSFRVGFDDALRPFVVDASGRRLEDLPKPNAKDDSMLSAAAIETWTTMKEDARTLVPLETLRLSRAMASQRRWTPKDFDAFFVYHPILLHLVRRLVWGTFSCDGHLTATFRVTEDRSYVDVNDEAFDLPDDGHIGLPHRLELSDQDVAAWSTVLHDREIHQPFEQLVRKTYRLPNDKRSTGEILRVRGRGVESQVLMGLLDRGWRRTRQSHPPFNTFLDKPISQHLTAELYVKGSLGGFWFDYLPNVYRTLEHLRFVSSTSAAVKLADVPPAVVSEVLRDIALVIDADPDSEE